MWLLKDNNGKKNIYLWPNKMVSVGRKQADITLENDSSISRTHASINVTLKDQMRISETSSTCIIKDVNSKYGTCVIRNNAQIKVLAEGLELQDGDIIKFGLQQHSFKVKYIRFVTVISRLSVAHKKILTEIMDNIGGIIIDCYDDNCTHLTATTATSTNKIISALIAGIPIISIDYWVSVMKAMGTNNDLPDPNIFTLTLEDKGVNIQRASLKPNPDRKILFHGKTFIFFSEKSYKEYKKMIKDAGGKAELYIIDSPNIPESLFASNNILMQLTEETMSDNAVAFNSILYDQLQEKKLRMISESEIPLAIIYVSVQQYCNPKYHFKELMRRKSLKKDTSEVLALDTQDIVTSTPNIDIGVGSSKQVLIPETNDFTQDCILDKDDRSLKNVDVSNRKNFSNINCLNIEKCSLKDNAQLQINREQILIRPKSPKIEEVHFDDNINEEIMTEENLNRKSKNNLVNEIVKESGISKSKTKQSTFVLKKPRSAMAEQESRKRQRDNSNEDENNVHSNGKNIEKLNQIEVTKKRRKSLIEVEDDFAELKSQRNKLKEKQQCDLNKWGFKRTEKRAIEFDIDELDNDEQPKIKIKKEIIDIDEPKEYLGKPSKPKKYLTLDEDNEEKEDAHSFEKTKQKTVKEKFNNPTCTKLLKENEIQEPLFVNVNIKMESDSQCTDNYKAFKKAHIQIPKKRIALSDMTVWRSNK